MIIPHIYQVHTWPQFLLQCSTGRMSGLSSRVTVTGGVRMSDLKENNAAIGITGDDVIEGNGEERAALIDKEVCKPVFCVFSYCLQLT